MPTKFTSFRVLDKVCDTKTGLCSQSLYMLALIVSSAMLAHSLLSEITLYLSYPVTTNIQIVDDGDISFPDISIEFLNWLDWTDFCRYHTCEESSHKPPRL